MARQKVRVASFAAVISIERSGQAPVLLLCASGEHLVCWTMRCRQVDWLMSSVSMSWGVK